MFKYPFVKVDEKAAQITQKQTILQYCIAKGLRYEQFDNFNNYYQQEFVFHDGINRFRKLHARDLDLLDLFKRGIFTLPINVYKDIKEGYGVKSSRLITKKEIVVIYCGDVIKNKYVSKLKINEYAMNLINSVDEEQGLSICPVQHWSLGMLLNHSPDPMYQNVEFTVVIGLANKPLIIGYANKEIKQDTPMRYDYNGSVPGLYDTTFSQARISLIAQMNNLDIDLMMMSLAIQQKKLVEIQIQAGFEIAEREVQTDPIQSQNEGISKDAQVIIDKANKQVKMYKLAVRGCQDQESERKKLQQKVLNLSRLAQLYRQERDMSMNNQLMLIKQFSHEKKARNQTISSSKPKLKIRPDMMKNFDVDSIVATYKVQFLQHLYPGVFAFSFTQKHAPKFKLEELDGNILLLTSTLFNVYIPQSYRNSIINRLEKENTLMKSTNATLITCAPLYLCTSQVVSILVGAGVEQVRIIKLGMKMPIQEFADIFLNEYFVIKESNRIDVAYRDGSNFDSIALWHLVSAQKYFKQSIYFQGYPLMSKTHGTFNVVFDGSFCKIYSSFSHRFMNKIQGPNQLTSEKLSRGLWKTFKFSMDKTFGVYTRYQVSQKGMKSMLRLIEEGAAKAARLADQVKQNLKPQLILLQDYDLLKKEAFNSFAAYYHKKNSWQVKKQKYELLLWRIGWYNAIKPSNLEKQLDVFQKIKHLDRSIAVKQLEPKKKEETQFNEEEPEREPNLRRQMKDYLKSIKPIESEEHKMNNRIGEVQRKVQQKKRKGNQPMELELSDDSQEDEPIIEEEKYIPKTKDWIIQFARKKNNLVEKRPIWKP